VGGGSRFPRLSFCLHVRPLAGMDGWAGRCSRGLFAAGFSSAITAPLAADAGVLMIPLLLWARRAQAGAGRGLGAHDP
jgi:hypothetical protein